MTGFVDVAEVIIVWNIDQFSTICITPIMKWAHKDVLLASLLCRHFNRAVPTRV
jgi:hypothetical protein